MVMSEVFWVGFYFSMIAMILGIGSQCYKSKCKEVNLCCIKIVHDVQGEEEICKRQQQAIQNNSNAESPPSTRV
jgi:hypothetical protein